MRLSCFLSLSLSLLSRARSLVRSPYNFLSLSTLRRLRHSFSVLSRSIARRGRGDAATPCPSIPLQLARGSQPWSKYFVISLPDSRNGRTLQLARHRRYSLSCYWLSDRLEPNNTRYRAAAISAPSKPPIFLFVYRTVQNAPRKNLYEASPSASAILVSSLLL